MIFNEIEKDHLGFLYRQYGITLKHLSNNDETVRYFLKAVEHKDLPSCIELAKIFEHSQKNFKEALKYTELAISIAYNSLNGLIQERKIQSLIHRKDRILRKAAINEKQRL